jgi:hypothetical protein
VARKIKSLQSFHVHFTPFCQVVWKPLEALILRTFRKTSDGLIRAQWRQHPLAPPPLEEAAAHHHHHHHHHHRTHYVLCYHQHCSIHGVSTFQSHATTHAFNFLPLVTLFRVTIFISSSALMLRPPPPPPPPGKVRPQVLSLNSPRKRGSRWPFTRSGPQLSSRSTRRPSRPRAPQTGAPAAQ